MTNGESLAPPDHDRPAADAASGNGRPGGASSALRLLLVDDNPDVARAMAIAFEVAGHALSVATGPEDAVSRLAAARFDAILLDLNFTPGRTNGAEGLALLARILGADRTANVIVVTAHSGIRIAVAAMQAGARDVVIKPWRNAELVEKVVTAARTPRPPLASQAPGRSTATGAEAFGLARLIGDSAAMRGVRDLIRRIAPTRAPALIAGPSGSGRSLAADILHQLSPDAPAAPLAVDLRDPDAWAGVGAARGTLILRHADRLDDVAQDRLAGLIPGEARPLTIVAEPERLEPGLAARIATIAIRLPPLAARAGDARLLGHHFARLAAARHGRPAAGFTPAAETALAEQQWPGEVRGLAQTIERAVLLSDDGLIDAAALLPVERPPPRVDRPAAGPSLAHSERAAIEAALRANRHNVTQAAAALGLSRGALYRRMERHGL